LRKDDRCADQILMFEVEFAQRQESCLGHFSFPMYIAREFVMVYRKSYICQTNILDFITRERFLPIKRLSNDHELVDDVGDVLWRFFYLSGEE
jgi:hypothetical protein